MGDLVAEFQTLQKLMQVLCSNFREVERKSRRGEWADLGQVYLGCYGGLTVQTVG